MIGLLSIPTWIIHIGSVLEWAVAMSLFYVLGRYTGNVWLKRMPLFMLPYGLSGVCAIAFHLTGDTANFFNDAQAYLTLSGSSCFALWAWLLLRDLTQAKATQAQPAPPKPAKLSYTLHQTSPATKVEEAAKEVQRG